MFNQMLKLMVNEILNRDLVVTLMNIELEGKKKKPRMLRLRLGGVVTGVVTVGVASTGVVARGVEGSVLSLEQLSK